MSSEMNILGLQQQHLKSRISLSGLRKIRVSTSDLSEGGEMFHEREPLKAGGKKEELVGNKSLARME